MFRGMGIGKQVTSGQKLQFTVGSSLTDILFVLSGKDTRAFSQHLQIPKPVSFG